MKEKNFTKSIFIMTAISEECEIENQSKHDLEAEARIAMSKYDPKDCIIICISSDGIECTQSISHKPPTDGHSKGDTIHAGKNVVGIARDLLHEMAKLYGRQVRIAANEARKLASETVKDCA